MNKRLKEGEYMKVRVHELAKKYDIKNKEFLEILKKDIGITVTSHLSNLDEDQVKKIDDYFAKMNMLKVETIELWYTICERSIGEVIVNYMIRPEESDEILAVKYDLNGEIRAIDWES